jgi:hypothetical protein
VSRSSEYGARLCSRSSVLLKLYTTVIHGVDEAIANVTAAFGDRAPDKAASPAQSERPRRPDAP